MPDSTIIIEPYPLDSAGDDRRIVKFADIHVERRITRTVSGRWPFRKTTDVVEFYARHRPTGIWSEKWWDGACRTPDAAVADCINRVLRSR